MIRWKEYRVKDVAKKIGSGATPNSNNDKYYDNGIFHWINTGDFNNSDIYFGKQMITEQALNEVSALRFYPVDTVLVAMYGASIGKIGLLKVKATVNQACCAIVPDRRLCLPRYLFYVLMNNKDSFLQKSFGGTQPNISQTIVSNLVLYIPSLSVQQRIVDYLDEKLAKIDGRIAVLEKQQDAYARLKKSIIHQAVTHGLNPDVRLKDSGIEWIGMIPEHWEVKRIKDVVSINTHVLPENTPYDYTFKYIDIGNVSSEGKITIGDDLSFYEAPSRARRIIKEGDVLVSTVRTYLRAIARINFEANDRIASTGFAVLSPKTRVDSSFVVNAVRDAYIVDAICSSSTGVSYPAISALRLSSISLATPPLSEQQAIANYLDEKCAKIDAAIENIGKQIDASKRLKRALINEVITGQRAI